MLTRCRGRRRGRAAFTGRHAPLPPYSFAPRPLRPAADRPTLAFPKARSHVQHVVLRLRHRGPSAWRCSRSFPTWDIVPWGRAGVGAVARNRQSLGDTAYGESVGLDLVARARRPKRMRMVLAPDTMLQISQVAAWWTRAAMPQASPAAGMDLGRGGVLPPATETSPGGKAHESGAASPPRPILSSYYDPDGEEPREDDVESRAGAAWPTG